MKMIGLLAASFRGCVWLLALLVLPVVAADTVKIGMTFPNTGRYKNLGIDQARGALLAIDEINAAGGVLGKPLELLLSASGRKGKEQEHVSELVNAGVSMAFGSSLQPQATATAAANANLLYFDTLFHSPGDRIQRPTVFYASYDAWMAAKTLAFYINQSLGGKKMFYITSDSTGGLMTEQILRKFTHTTDLSVHGQSLTRFPGPRRKEFIAAVEQARDDGAEVLVLVQAGDDLAKALQVIHELGLTTALKIVAPNMTLSVARAVGADRLEGVIATVPWSWQVAKDYRYGDGVRFTEAYVARYETNPSALAATAYSLVWHYQRVAEEAGTLDSRTLAKRLEGLTFTGLKDPQSWRRFDHLSVQSVYVVTGKPREQVMQGSLREDYFRVVSNIAGQIIVPTEKEVAERAWE
jgi:ABC-type branched-subunit amino acid transport system substrate-binding protein